MELNITPEQWGIAHEVYHWVIVALDKGSVIAAKVSSVTTPLLGAGLMYYNYLKAKKDAKKEGR